jgi:hypothetical protein
VCATAKGDVIIIIICIEIADVLDGGLVRTAFAVL